jgi:zinc transport system permease protein
MDLHYLSYDFMQRSLLAGCVLAALLGLLGVLVTARGLAYLGDGLSHAAFGGITLGMFLGLTTPLYIAIPFTALAAVGIGIMRRRGGLRSDVAMATLFAVCFSAGIILLRAARKHPNAGSPFAPESLLFGDILLVGRDDLRVVLGVAAVTLLVVGVLWTRLAYATFDEELARLSGIQVGWLESVLLALLAAVVVAAIRLAGVVLVSAFLVVPSAAGRLLGRSLGGVVLWAMGVGVVGVLVGFMVAHALDWPEGATIVLVLAGFLVLAMARTRLQFSAKRRA